jgi:hypothetical protein
MNVKVIRMSSGEDVVADVLENKEESLVLMNPIGICSLVSSSEA